MALDDFRLRFGKVLMEFIGTFVLVLTIQVAVKGTAIAVGLALAVVVYCGGPISGAHYNPAVSLAMFLRSKLSLANLVLYWAFQLGGAICGALLGAAISGRTAVPALGPDSYLVQAFLAEFVFTALLALTVLATCTNKKVENNSYYGIAIGSVVLVGIYGCADVSGAVFNPAVAFSLSIVHGLLKIAYMLMIILAEAAGGIAGAAIFYLVAPDEFEQFNEEARQLLPSRS